MTRPARLKYGTFSLGSDQVGGVVHLRSALPEVIALGIDAWKEFVQGVWPLGGPHAEVKTDPLGTGKGTARLHVLTPECRFTYEVIRVERDTAGLYMVMKRVYVSTSYAEFAEALRG